MPISIAVFRGCLRTVYMEAFPPYPGNTPSPFVFARIDNSPLIVSMIMHNAPSGVLADALEELHESFCHHRLNEIVSHLRTGHPTWEEERAITLNRLDGRRPRRGLSRSEDIARVAENMDLMKAMGRNVRSAFPHPGHQG